MRKWIVVIVVCAGGLFVLLRFVHVDDAQPVPIAAGVVGVSEMAWSASGNGLAVSWQPKEDAAHIVQVIPVDENGAPPEVATGVRLEGGGLRHIEWSPDGTHLLIIWLEHSEREFFAAAEGDRVGELMVSTANAVLWRVGEPLSEATRVPCTMATWGADSSTLYVIRPLGEGRDEVLRVCLGREEGSETVVWRPKDQYPMGLRLSPNGRYLAALAQLILPTESGGYRSAFGLCCVDLVTGHAEIVADDCLPDMHCWHWADGATLAYVAYDREDTGSGWRLAKVAFAAVNGEPRHTAGKDIKLPSDGRSAAALSPDGAKVAFTHVVGDSTSIAVVDLHTGRAADLVPSVDPLDLAWSPDGTELAIATGRERVGPGPGVMVVYYPSGDIRAVDLRTGEVDRAPASDDGGSRD